MEFKELCLKELEKKNYSEELKLAVIESKSKEEFEALGGNEDIYYDIKGVVNRVAHKILNNHGRTDN